MRDVDHRVIVAAGPTGRQATAHGPTVPTRDVIAWDDGQASLWHGGGFRKSRIATAGWTLAALSLVVHLGRLDSALRTARTARKAQAKEPGPPPARLEFADEFV
jgi:hypothetical protein